MARTCIIGDVHGMLPELVALIEALSPTKDDVLVFTGDLVDKGPDSAGVVRYVRELREAGYTVVLVRGNHEEKHERFRKGFAKTLNAAKRMVADGRGRGDPEEIALGMIKNKGSKNVDEMHAITSALSDEDIAFLDSAVLYHRLPEHHDTKSPEANGSLVVHAGIPGDLKSLPTAEELASMSKAARQKVENSIMRVRHVRGRGSAKVSVEFDLTGVDAEQIENMIRNKRLGDHADKAKILKMSVKPKGGFIALGDETEEDPFWADAYFGRFGHVYFGHSPYPEENHPMRWMHATGLDLGAVFGGRLASVVLEIGKDPKFVSVPSRGKFAKALWD